MSGAAPPSRQQAADSGDCLLRLRPEQKLRQRIVRVHLLRHSGCLEGPLHVAVLQLCLGQMEPSVHVRRIDRQGFLKDVLGLLGSSLLDVYEPEVAVWPFKVWKLQNAFLKGPNGTMPRQGSEKETAGSFPKR